MPGSQKKTPELTLDRTVGLLRRAMEIPGLGLDLGLLLVDWSQISWCQRSSKDLGHGLQSGMAMALLALVDLRIPFLM